MLEKRGPMYSPAGGRSKEMGRDGTDGMRLDRWKGAPHGPGALHPLEGVCHGLARRRGLSNGVDARDRMTRATGVGILGSDG